MSDPTTPGATADPQVLGLVPAPRRRTALVTGVLAALLLAGAWWSTAPVPRLTADDGAAGAVHDLGDGRVLVGVVLERGGVGPVELLDVEDVPGARVLGAWLEATPADSPGESVFGRGGPGTPVPGAPLGEAAALPARSEAGDGGWLVVLWDVDDCTTLLERAVAPVARVRTVAGITIDAPLPELASPAAAACADA
ncbi:hypothetical protein [Cellulomonas oligotrophica]|nr:hypothetical protein [Cellulomonas oligotrophica]GIG32547.1 hypothetical protein Col01nite_17060 [Cellulomonas oligotrophica]